MTTLTEKAVDGTGRWVDDRFASSNFIRRSIDKVFPHHWSFMLGEIALYSFIILLATGTYLAFFYTPSQTEVIYNGSYTPLVGISMSGAYASTLHLTFDVRGGLLMRQIHHWAALLFMVSIVIHLMRIFFTGAFRKPRELNWVIGSLLMIMGILEGFVGYSLPDDLLSGTGVRIAWGILLSIPVAGTWLAFIIFGGEFPGTEILNRFYIAHVFIIPLLLLGLITAHMMIMWYQKHTQFAGPGRTEDNVVGSRFFPVFTAKAGGFFFLVFAVLAALGGLAQINPVWLYGPFNASQVSAGSQPDWYMGFLDGATRITPGIELHLGGHTVPFNILVPTVILPGIVFTGLILYPWIEAFLTKDKAYHNLLDRPRDRPVRTALGAMSIAFYLVLLIGGGNDIIASIFHLSINQITYTLRVLLFVLPPVVYWCVKRICLGMQESDEELIHHGIESGTIRRLPSGEFVEETVPVPVPQRIALTRVAPGEIASGALDLPSEHGQDETYWVDNDLPRARGFFRARNGDRSTPTPSPENTFTPELEGSGQQ